MPADPNMARITPSSRSPAVSPLGQPTPLGNALPSTQYGIGGASSSGHPLPNKMKGRQILSRPRQSRGRSRRRSVSKRPPQPPIGHHDAPARSWANVARLAVKGSELPYVPPTYVDGEEAVVNLPDEALDAMDPKWNDCLVGFLVGGKKFPFGLVEQSLRRVWGSRVGEIFADDQGFVFLQIPDPGYRRKILEGVPVTVARVPLILRQWKPLMELKKENQSAIPVWIRLRNLPIECWTVPAMGAIASSVGKPLYADQRTDQMQMLSYARICVEITPDKPRVKKAKVTLKGVSRVVSIEYEWLPAACLDCNAFGHNCRAPPQEQRASGRNPNPKQAARRPARQPSIAPTPPSAPAPLVVDPAGPQRASSPPLVVVASEQVGRRSESVAGPPRAVGGVRIPTQEEVDPGRLQRASSPPLVVVAPEQIGRRSETVADPPRAVGGVRTPTQAEVDPARLQPASVSVQTAPAEDSDPPQVNPDPQPAQNQARKKAKRNKKKKKESVDDASSSSSIVAGQHSRGNPRAADSPPPALARLQLSRGKAPAADPPHPAPAHKGGRAFSVPPKIVLSLTAGRPPPPVPLRADLLSRMVVSRPPPALPLRADQVVDTEESEESELEAPDGATEAPDESSDEEDISHPESPLHPPPLAVTSVETIQGRMLALAPDPEPEMIVTASGAPRRKSQKQR